MLQQASGRTCINAYHCMLICVMPTLQNVCESLVVFKIFQAGYVLL